MKIFVVDSYQTEKRCIPGDRQEKRITRQERMNECNLN